MSDDCPIKLEHCHEICSAGTCKVCRTAKAKRRVYDDNGYATCTHCDGDMEYKFDMKTLANETVCK